MNRNPLKLIAIFFALLSSCLFGCSVSRSEQIPWRDITSVDSTDFNMISKQKKILKKNQAEKTAIRSLSPTLQRYPLLARLVVSRSIDRPVIYEKGVLGDLGNAKIFVAERRFVPDFDRLYWVIVKTLSTKYGCFMVSRIKRDEVLTIKCRDRRNIVLWRSMGKNWIQFASRQYDRHGYEIVVRNKRKIRISKKPFLDLLL